MPVHGRGADHPGVQDQRRRERRRGDDDDADAHVPENPRVYQAIQHGEDTGADVHAARSVDGRTRRADARVRVRRVQ